MTCAVFICYSLVENVHPVDFLGNFQTNFDYLYVRPEKDDIMAGFQAPAPNARGHKVSALVEVPILKQLPPNNGSYLK